MSVSRKARQLCLADVLHALLDDVFLVNGKKNTSKDKETLLQRFQSEGIPFFSKTLPLLGKALDLALRTGHFCCPTQFGRYKRSALPEFLRGLLLRIFDHDGCLRENADIAAICEVRQICYVFYKYITDFSPRQQRDAEVKFKEVDQNLPLSLPFDHPVVSEVLFHANRFLIDLLSDFDPHDITPGHGPGIVASGEKPHEKYNFSTKYERLHEQYPYYRYFYVNFHHLWHGVDNYISRPTKEVGINKVLFVPKDSRGPRTIACEPLEYQYIQQGIMRKLVPYVESHRLTRGRVNFSDQSINRELARRGSLGEPLVTLDLKDASDSVSMSLVERLFAGTSLLQPLKATRTPFSLLPSGEVIELRKFAAMGSALCFPVEALTFYALLMGCYVLTQPLEPIGFVYGDDIIVPPQVSEFYIQMLEAVGLKVNLDKSCLTGLFRESCGGEYFSGFDVSYLKCKTLDIKEPSALASVVALSNMMFERGFYRTASVLDSWVSSTLKIPEGLKDSGYLCLYNERSYPSFGSSKRWHKKHQCFYRRVPQVIGVTYEHFHHHTSHEPYMRKHLQGWGDSYVDARYAKRGAKLRYHAYPVGM